ncbi:MAG: MFS transporter [Gammaproteobacteria bacterium]|nr:MFS transporter [Gammaproteobacteria bacterium]MYD76678.1 MFS transporter [Gammaproteobacteria bacterium]MYJ52914.1 MFS transporter [Gammaproteobacteria bacterium]
MTSRKEKRRMARPSFAVLRAANSLILMTIALSGMYVSIMVLDPVSREFLVGRGDAALPYTFYMLGFGIGNVALGRIMDRYGLFPLSLVAAVCLPLGLYLASSSQSLWTFSLVLLVLCGLLGGGFAFGPLVADISQWFEGRRGLAVGLVISGSYVAGAIWPPLLQGWIDTLGWRESLVQLSFLCALSMPVLSLVYLRKPDLDSAEVDAETATRWSRPLGLRQWHLQCLMCCAGIGCCVAMAMPQIHIVPHAIDLGFTAQDGAIMLALMLGCGVVSRVASGLLSDRIGGTRTLALGSLLQMTVLAAFLFVDGLTGLYLVSIAFGLSQGGIVPSYAIVIRRFFRPSEAGSRIGLVYVSTILGMALGGWMAGVLYDLTGSYRVSFINAIAFNMLNLLIVGFMLRRDDSPAFAR